jgi:ribose 5-phosphate isomerase A
VLHSFRAPPLAASASSSFSLEQRAAAQAAVDAHVRSGHTIAVGAGPLVSLAVEYIGQQLAAGRLKDVKALPTCALAASEVAFHGVPCVASSSSAEDTVPDLLIEQPDTLDYDAGLTYLTGGATGASQPQLRHAQQLRESAARVILLAMPGSVGNGEGLTGSIPVLLPAAEWEEIAEELDDLFIGDAEVWRRPMSGTGADPQGGPMPYVSAEGHTIVDLRFEDGFRMDGAPAAPADIVSAIESIPGVLAHGLAVGLATAAYVPNMASPTEPRILFPLKP